VVAAHSGLMSREMLDAYERRLVWGWRGMWWMRLLEGRSAREVAAAHGISKSWIYVLIE
jgi:hypothetical protein